MAINPSQMNLDPPEFLSLREAEKYAKLSYSTLKRRHYDGHDTGMRKLGRRVVFHTATLRQFLLSICRAVSSKSSAGGGHNVNN